MDQMNLYWAIGGLIALALGPAGGVWAGMRGTMGHIEKSFDAFVIQMKNDRTEDREWMKDLQVETHQNSKDIVRLDERQKNHDLA